jgi:hypothetical protein
MTTLRLPTLLVASALVLGALSACQELPADEPAQGEQADSAQPAEEEASSETAPVAPSDEEAQAAVPQGCLTWSDDVRDELTAQVSEHSATVGTAAKTPLDVNEMVYGTWEVNAVTVTSSDGVEEVGVWATKVLSPSEWSSAAGAGETMAYAVNEVAATMSNAEMATEDLFGRPVTMEDAEVMAALDCLAQME